MLLSLFSVNFKLAARTEQKMMCHLIKRESKAKSIKRESKAKSIEEEGAKKQKSRCHNTRVDHYTTADNETCSQDSNPVLGVSRQKLNVMLIIAVRRLLVAGGCGNFGKYHPFARGGAYSSIS